MICVEHRVWHGSTTCGVEEVLGFAPLAAGSVWPGSLVLIRLQGTMESMDFGLPYCQKLAGRVGIGAQGVLGFNILA